MRMLTFARRNGKEILRDPLNLAFGLGFPLVLLLLLSAIQAGIPVSLFEIDRLTPGITVFGLSFMTLFSATIIAKDRGSALLQRLYTTPLTAADFILGYTLPILLIAAAQCVICYVAAVVLGLQVTVGILYAVIFILPVALLFVGLGLLFGNCVLVDVDVSQFAAHTRNHLQDVGNGTHLLDLLHLLQEIVQREGLRAELVLQLGGRFLVEAVLSLFDQGQHVAHAQNAA